MGFSFFLACIVAYLLGSIPSAVWTGKFFYGVDVRKHGSGNAGATNTVRVLGKGPGLFVLLADFLKGFAAVNLADFNRAHVTQTGTYVEMQMLLGAFAVAGHIYPVFASFKGGKGIATLVGVICAINMMLALLCFVTFALIVAFTRYISLGSITASVLSPLYAGVVTRWSEPPLIWFCVIIAIVVTYTHRSNIGRLRKGTENKFNFSKKPRVNIDGN